MNREYAVVYNRSLESIFSGQAHAVARELDCPCLYTDELQFLEDEQIEFRKCVYFDKDVVTGLRLEAIGVRLFNNIGSIELCDDKRRTGEFLKRELRVPKTLIYPLFFSDLAEYRLEFTQKAADMLGFPMIAKLAFGSLGEQVRLVENVATLSAIIEEWKNEPFLLQEYVASSRGRDLRLYVVGGEVKGAMERCNPNDFRSNVGSGGHGRITDVPDGFAQAATDACALLGLDFAGVDLLYGSNGEPIVCEVNSNGLFRELNRVCSVSIEREIAEHVRRSEQNSFQVNDLFL